MSLNSPRTKTLAKWTGGSHLYRINNADSDIDVREIFAHTNWNYLLGLDTFDHQTIQEGGVDIVAYSLKKFLLFCQKSNTQCLECLFLDQEDFRSVDKYFLHNCIYQRKKLIDAKSFFKSLTGYLYNEYRLTVGERSGRLGSKRKNTVEKYGYSYKNLANLIRLGECGICFFKTGVFPTRLYEISDVRDEIIDIRKNPENYNTNYAINTFRDLDKRLKEAYDGSTIKDDFQFSKKYANEILINYYIDGKNK